MAKTKTERKIEDLEREVRRLNHFLSNANKVAARETRRAEDLQKAYEAEARGFHNVLVRLAFVYGEDEIDETRGKVVGKRFVIPQMDAAYVRAFEVHNRKDEDGNDVIGICPHDCPDYNKYDAELEAEAAAYREAQRKCEA